LSDKRKNLHHEQAHELALRRLAETQPEGAAVRSGTVYDAANRRFIVPYGGRDYHVAYPGGEVTLASDPGAPVDLTIKIVLLHYLLNATGIPARGTWVAYHELPGGEYHAGLMRFRDLRPLARTFGHDPGLLAAVGRDLDGRDLDLGHGATVIDMLPRVPVAFAVWAGDDEFGPSASIVFDASAPGYLPVEDLEYVAFHGVQRLRAVAATQAPEGAMGTQRSRPVGDGAAAGGAAARTTAGVGAGGASAGSASDGDGGDTGTGGGEGP